LRPVSASLFERGVPAWPEPITIASYFFITREI
jgi:hypothetical protein